MTSQFDGYESETLFNSMQEGGKGVFSLMVDLKKIVNVGEDLGSAFPLAAEAKDRSVLVGQEVRVCLTERSVSPIAGDVKVVWSNGFEGDTYQVKPEDLGTNLTAVATFEGADMRPLEVTIECGPVVLAPAPEIDLARITVTGEGVSGDEHDLYALREYKQAHLYVDSTAFSTPVDSINVRWSVDGTLVGVEKGIEPKVLTSALDLERLVMATNEPPAETAIVELPQSIAELPDMLAQLLVGHTIPGLGEMPAVSADLTEDVMSLFDGVAVSEVAPKSIPAGKTAVMTDGAPRESDQSAGTEQSSGTEQSRSDVAEIVAQTPAQILAASEPGHDAGVPVGAQLLVGSEELEAAVDVTDPFFTASVKLPQGVAGGALSVEITGVTSGTESATVKMFAGVIAAGQSYALKPNVAVRVAEPRVGEEAWAKVKRKNFVPAAETFAYQWLIGGQEIYGETESRVHVTPQMRGRELSVLIEVSGETAVTSTLEASLGVVGLGDAPEYLGDALEIVGKARVGKTLTLTMEHDFVYPDADSVEIQWMRGREPIVGARGLTYEVGIEDAEEKLWARVLLRKLGHASTVLKTSKVRVKG